MEVKKKFDKNIKKTKNMHILLFEKSHQIIIPCLIIFILRAETKAYTLMMNTKMESLIIKNNDEAIEKEKEKQQHNDEGTKTYEQNYVLHPNYVCV